MCEKQMIKKGMTLEGALQGPKGNGFYMDNNNLSHDDAEAKHFTMLDIEVWNRFVKPGEVVEIRLLEAFGKHIVWGGGFAKGTVSGYFDNHEDFCKYLKWADQVKCSGVYFTLQVIDPRLIGRGMNRLNPAKSTTSDSNILYYRWLPIDIDPVRPSGISSSDSELQAAMDMREEVAAWVVGNMALPAPMKGMSDNGGHLLFPLPELPASVVSTNFIKKALQGLSDRFSNDQVGIDTTVFNPARIWKAYGTTARKGDSVPANEHREARPHRQSFIDDLGEVQP